MGWMIWSFQSHGIATGTFETDSTVRVQHVSDSWRFSPVGHSKSAGLVFLPGGMVDPKAYGPIARRLAEIGYPVAIVELPLRMARSAAAEATVRDRAREARNGMAPDIPWVLAGHSRGAAIATRLVAREPAAYQGLALVATTHPRVDLSSLEIPVFKIGGTRDCVAPREKSEAAAESLPPGTQWRWIEGANHAQFGWYGSQLGDCRASIERGAQQRALMEILRQVLAEVESASSGST